MVVLNKELSIKGTADVLVVCWNGQGLRIVKGSKLVLSGDDPILDHPEIKAQRLVKVVSTVKDATAQELEP